MYPDLAARIRQDGKKLNRNELYFIRDYSLADGSFILYHFISSYLRSPDNGNVYLLALNHPFNHYKIVLAKLGVQLQRFVDQNRCRVFDFNHHLYDENENPEIAWFRQKDPSSSSGYDEAENAVKNLYLLVKNDIESMMSNSSTESKSSPPLLIVIDCISILLDLQVPLKYVVHFLHYIRQLGRQYNASFAILAKTDQTFHPSVCDDAFISNYDRLASFLASSWIPLGRMIVFDVKPLSTGWSHDVHGEVTIRGRKAYVDECKGERTEEEEHRLLYRLGDRNVAFMPPGLVPRVGV